MSGTRDKKMSESVQNVSLHTGIEKRCVRCGATDRNKRGECLPCKRAASAIWRTAHTDRIKECNAAYYTANREQLNKRNTEWKSNHPEKVKALNAKWQAEHTEEIKMYGVKWRAEHTEEIKAYKAKYQVEHPEVSRTTLSRWRAKHPEGQRAQQNKRRNKALNVGGSFSAAEIRAMMKNQKGKCVVCRTNITNNYHVDHILPIALGGGSGIWNIQLLCPDCNRHKGSLHPIDFMKSRGFLL